MNRHTVALAALLISVTSGPAGASDLAHGKQLKQTNCMSCHGDEMYTREDRKITTREGLRNQVRRCELTLGLQWFDEDIDDVSGYLNNAFYKFK